LLLSFFFSEGGGDEGELSSFSELRFTDEPPGDWGSLSRLCPLRMGLAGRLTSSFSLLSFFLSADFIGVTAAPGSMGVSERSRASVRDGEEPN
jgi:hypothetical protein